MGEPAWESLIGRLSRVSADFARLWEAGDVSPPGNRMKVIQHASVGEIRLVSTSLAVGGVPETRIVVYTPADEESRELTEALRGIHDSLTGCPEHLRPASRARAELERKWERSGGSPAER
ncbi:MmyB family transcriptional regulator [Streptomyces decoyicus]|uniref:MmyB family transcriptional regulator n=1 Tax=Streptomyces decoyicus TaxID=249567 RepID=UPI0033BE61E4